MRKLILHIAFVLSGLTVLSQNSEITLNTKWEFRQKGTTKWHPASVPGTVHTDLFTNKLIPDPFFAANEKNLQWIENEDWEYRTEFACTKKTLSNNHVEIKFEGLDTYARVFLNGTLIIEANNMFRSWTVDIKKNLKEGNNTILVVFESAVKKGKAEAAKLSYTLPGDEKVFTRKAQYQYGWDFGPRFVTCGIWKPIKLITWNKVKIESIYAYTKEIKDSIAKMDFIIETTCETEGYYEIRYNYGDKKSEQSRVLSQLVILKPGTSTTTLSYNIPKPKLWWCNGMEKRRPSLYTAAFKITKNDSTIEQQSLSFGVRTIELMQEKDSAGTSFYFKLNGVPVYIKGANYIPPDNFLPRKSKEGYHSVITMVKAANMNMLRVWGGGAYPNQQFYNECDRAGILVWQDLMFACAMYPGNDEFIDNVKKEVTEQVKNLRGHPSLALWCGNNEIDEGWHNWGWQKQFKYSKKDSTQIWNDYKKLFHEIIPGSVKQNDPETSYWPSSPSIGWGHKESLQQGDSHYWGVWWGNEPFENYRKKVGRFMSEYGCQSAASLATFKSICDETDLNLDSAAVKNHQKHPTGYETITTYMKRDFKVPKDFDKFIYVSQLLQAFGMKTAIEAHRLAKPYCMGTLFWQLNDCWPGTSWSCIDYNNIPKAFYYSLKDLYGDVLIAVKKKDNEYSIHIVNDKFKTFPGRLTLSVKDFFGKEVLLRTSDIKVLSNSSGKYYSISEKDIPGFDAEKMYLSCRVTSSDETTSAKTLFYFVSPKDLKLPQPNITPVYDSEKRVLRIKSTCLVKDLFMYDEDLTFYNNYFDLEPGEEKEITVSPEPENLNKLKILSLYNINNSPE